MYMLRGRKAFGALQTTQHSVMILGGGLGQSLCGLQYGLSWYIQ